MIRLLIILSIAINISFARNGSGGGDIVGNGGGLGEQNFIYALAHLPEFISITLQYDTMSEDQRDDLTSIFKIARTQYNKSDKLKFLSEKDHPGFFRSSTDPEIRLAKTDFSPDSLIYVNLDLIYKRDAAGDLQILSMPTMVASLVHEFGHQAGLRDHHYLDLLGARVRRIVDRGMNQLKMVWRERTLFVNTISMGPLHSALINYNYEGKVVSLDRAVRANIACKNEADKLIGYNFENQHFSDLFEGYENVVIPFKAWVVISCLDSNGKVNLEKGLMNIVFLIDIHTQDNPISTMSMVFGPI